MLIDCMDKVLIDYIDSKLDSLGIVYDKLWICKFDETITYNQDPLKDSHFNISYGFNSFKELHYMNKLAKEFITNREHLEKCLCLK